VTARRRRHAALAFATTATLLCAAVLDPVGTARAATAVTVVRTVPGHDGPNLFRPAAGADTNGAVGPRHVVDLTNRSFIVHDKATGAALPDVNAAGGSHTDLNAFWLLEVGITTNIAYDSRLVYDPVSARWFMSSGELDSTGRLLIAISADSDPTHGWKGFALASIGALRDNPKLVTDRNGLYVCDTRQLNTNDCYVFPMADVLWTGTGAPSTAHMRRFASLAYPLFPTYDTNPDKRPTDPEYLVARIPRGSTGDTTLQLRAVTWNGLVPSLSAGTVVDLGAPYPNNPTTFGIQPPLPNGSASPQLRPGEGRIVDAVFAAGSIWAIAATEIGGRVGAFWTAIDPATSTVRQRGDLGDQSADLLYPSLNVDPAGDVGIGMTRTSATQFPSAYVTGRAASDPPGTLRPLTAGILGTAVYTNTPVSGTNSVSWGDYSITWVDPTDPTLFWSVQEYARSTKFGVWSVGWTAFRVGGPGPSAPVVDSASVAPSAPLTNSVLSANVSSHDPDGDPVTLLYQWVKNGVDLAGATGPTLDLAVVGNGDHGDSITVRVQASDGAHGSAPVTAGPVNVLDAPPTATVALSPLAPGTDDVLTATVATSDVDPGDTVAATYVWKVGGTVVKQTSGSSSSTDTLDLSQPGNGDPGDVVTVEVTPSDGTTTGGTASASVTVRATPPGPGPAPPVVDSATITPALPSTNTVLTADVTSHDPDGDAVTLLYQWAGNGVDLTGATGPTLDLAAVGNGDHGDVVTVTVRGTDGAHVGPPVTTAPVTVQDTPPTATVALAPTAPATGDTLTATATRADIDPGDVVTLTYVWKVDGTVVRTTSGSSSGTDTLDLSQPGNGDPGQVVTVDATPSDGVLSGPGASASVTVAAPPTTVSFRSASPATNTVAASIAVAKPAGTTAGDVLLAALDVIAAPAVSAPAGWSLVRTDTSAASTPTVGQTVFVHVAGASEPAAYVFSWATAHGAAGEVLAYRGVDAAHPIDGHSGAVAAASSVTAPAVTGTAGGALVGLFGVNDVRATTPPAGMTERSEISLANPPGEKITAESADAAITVTGSSGPRTATFASAGRAVGQLVALHPG
jgi:hypothetical protein